MNNLLSLLWTFEEDKFLCQRVEERDVTPIMKRMQFTSIVYTRLLTFPNDSETLTETIAD